MTTALETSRQRGTTVPPDGEYHRVLGERNVVSDAGNWRSGSRSEECCSSVPRTARAGTEVRIGSSTER